MLTGTKVNKILIQFSSVKIFLSVHNESVFDSQKERD